jgi:hypothetical protein
MKNFIENIKISDHPLIGYLSFTVNLLLIVCFMYGVFTFSKLISNYNSYVSKCSSSRHLVGR